MRLTEKQQLFALIAVFALALLGEGLFGYSCLKKRNELQTDLDQLDQEERDAREKIARIPSLRDESAELAQIIEEYAEILPTAVEVSNDAFLEDIENFLDGTGLIMITGAPVEDPIRRRNKNQPVTPHNPFDQIKYKFELQGPFLGFVQFVNRVENHTRFLEILDFRLRPTGSSDRNVDPAEEVAYAENPNKVIEVVISTYTYSKPEPTVATANQ